MPSTTRGPLSPGVYWRRRLAVLSIALVLVLGVGKLLGSGSDGDPEETATQAGALASPTATSTAADPSASPTKKGKGKNRGGKGNGNGGGANASTEPTPTPTPTPTTPPPLPEPTGACADDDVFITATVASAVGGTDVTFLLNLQAKTSPACTWTVSPDTVSVAVTQGRDTVWSSEQCPDSVPTQDVVVRQASITQVPVVWTLAQRFDEECTRATAWALPGTYTVSTAALGGEPTDVQFDLAGVPTPTVTQTVTPTAPVTTPAG